MKLWKWLPSLADRVTRLCFSYDKAGKVNAFIVEVDFCV